MLERLFQNTTYKNLKTALDVAAARQAAIADNIANADTPGYKRKIVSFDEALIAAGERRGILRDVREVDHVNVRDVIVGQVSTAGAPQTAKALIRIIEDPDAIADENGNTVDLFREMSEQSENQMRFDALAQMVSDRLVGLRKVVTGSSGGQ